MVQPWGAGMGPREYRDVPTMDCRSCEETFAQEDGPVCPYCGHDHRGDGSE